VAEIFPQFTIYRDSISASRLRVGGDRAEMFRADFDTSIHPLQFPEKQAIEGEAHIERPTQRTCDSEAWLCHLAGILEQGESLPPGCLMCGGLFKRGYSRR